MKLLNAQIGAPTDTGPLYTHTYDFKIDFVQQYRMEMYASTAIFRPSHFKTLTFGLDYGRPYVEPLPACFDRLEPA
jgi:hypothetical protein